MHKTCVILLLLAALLLAALPALAASGTPAFIDAHDADAVDLYTNPSAGSQSMGLFCTGTPVTRLKAVKGDFSKVTIGAQTGWVRTDCLSDVQPLLGGPAGLPLAGQMWVNLRMKPSNRDRVLAMLYPDSTPFTILGETASGWYYVNAAGTLGYVAKEYAFASRPDMAWSLHHYAPTTRIDIAYPHFDHMPDAINALIRTYAEGLVRMGDYPTDDLSLDLNAAVTVCDRGLVSIVFHGSGYVDGGAYPTTVLYPMVLDLHTLSTLTAAQLLDLSGDADGWFFANAQAPAVTHDDLPADWFADRLDQQKDMADHSGSALSAATTCYLVPEGVVFVLPAIHASGSDYFEALIPWSAAASRWLLPTAMPGHAD